MRPNLKLSVRLALTSLMGLALCASMGVSGAQAQEKMKKDRTHRDRTMMAGDQSAGMSGMTEDENGERGMPIAPSYPWAAPGGLDMSHWTNFSAKHMRPGSAAEAALEARDAMHHARMDSKEDEAELVPVSPTYPHAAPGALDTYHWTDATRTHTMPGSAYEARMDKMHGRDRARAANLGHMEEDDELLPVTPSYPSAAPGSLDMVHWTDMRKVHMDAGSASETRAEKMEKQDRSKKMK